MEASAKECGIPIPKSRKEIEAIVEEGIKKCAFQDQYVKVIVTGGVAADAISVGPNPQLICTFQKAGTYAETDFSKGIKLMSVVHQRFYPKVKSTSYFPAVVSLQKARQVGASELLYVSESGDILEGGTVNFFAVQDGKLYTAEENILFGITRKKVLELAEKLNIPVVRARLSFSLLSKFDEAFITSTTREVMPVNLVDNVQIANGLPGPITKQLMEAFSKITKH